ncbi:MAG TPA: hypothetical protein VFV99_29685 [Kofleriaceae bacterium]|nr:hypothetical protein [Kofleriaceae bacterium]
MRFVLVALAVVGCHHNPGTPGPSTPANKAAAPDYRTTADDELGFLPVGTDIVIGMNVTQFRGTAMWNSLQPQIDGFRRELEQIVGDCSHPNPIDTIERGTVAINLAPDGNPHGVFVVRGIDTTRVLDCMIQQMKKEGGTGMLDRGVAIMSMPGSRTQLAAAVVGPSTLVMQTETTVTYDSMTKILTSGSPLRSSPVFMEFYKRREAGASFWGMANGNAWFFEELAQMGMRPKSLDGTLIVTDRLAFSIRMTMASPADAAKVSAELDKIKGPAGGFVQQFDTRIDDATLRIHVVMTEQQVRGLAGMLGGMP